MHKINQKAGTSFKMILVLSALVCCWGNVWAQASSGQVAIENEVQVKTKEDRAEEINKDREATMVVVSQGRQPEGETRQSNSSGAAVSIEYIKTKGEQLQQAPVTSTRKASIEPLTTDKGNNRVGLKVKETIVSPEKK